MYAVVITEPGGPEVLRWQEVPDPGEPGEGEVLLDVTATAINRADLLQRKGFYPPPAGAPPYPGMECSGVVRSVGAGVDGWRPGDVVAALASGGTYAEQVLVAAGQLMPIPDGVSVVEAAALPEVTATVWSNVFMLAALQPQETLLVHGGGSGIGTCAIQLAKAAGARVFVTAGSAEKLQRCLALGADVAISYRDEDFVERAIAETDGRGVDVILDNMGAKYLDRNVEALATSGRLVVIGLQGGNVAELDLRQLMSKRAAVLATTLRSRSAAEKAAIVRSIVEYVWPQVAAGAVRPVVDRILPIDQAAEGHRVLEAGENFGKVLLEIPPRSS